MPRQEHVAGKIGKELVVAGGMTDTESYSNTTEILDFDNAKSTVGLPMNEPRWHAAGTTIGQFNQGGKLLESWSAIRIPVDFRGSLLRLRWT